MQVRRGLQGGVRFEDCLGHAGTRCAASEAWEWYSSIMKNFWTTELPPQALIGDEKPRQPAVRLEGHTLRQVPYLHSGVQVCEFS